MATVREDLISDEDSTWFDTEGLAEEVTYNSSAISAHVIFGEEWDEAKGKVVNVCRIEIKKSDVTSPAYRDVIVIGTETWYMDHIESGDGITWILQLKQEERPNL